MFPDLTTVDLVALRKKFRQIAGKSVPDAQCFAIDAHHFGVPIAVDGLLDTWGYIGPNRQLPAIGETAETPRRAERLVFGTPRQVAAVLAPPSAPEDVKAALPKGFSYLGPRDTGKRLVWEAQHRGGVVFGETPTQLVERAKAVAAALSTGKPADNCEGFNRRRKTRSRKQGDLKRCVACSGLFFPDQLAEHAQEAHGDLTATPTVKQALFTKPATVEDDGTGDDPALDDPALARAVQEEI